jgi:hypothetical protein
VADGTNTRRNRNSNKRQNSSQVVTLIVILIVTVILKGALKRWQRHLRYNVESLKRARHFCPADSR